MKRTAPTQGSRIRAKRSRLVEAVPGFDWLPAELWQMLTEWCSIQDLLALRRVCRGMKQLVDCSGLLQREMQKERAWVLSRVRCSRYTLSWSWTHQQLQWSRAEVLTEVPGVVQQGHLRVLQWLHRRFVFTREELLGDYNEVFADAVIAGQLRVCKWLHTTFQLALRRGNLYDLCNLTHKFLSSAAEKGHVAVCKWLLPLLRPKQVPTELRQEALIALRIAAINGKLSVCRWLQSSFQFQQYEVMHTSLDEPDRLFCQIAEGGHVATCRWLYTTFDCSLEQLVVAPRFRVLLIALSAGHTHFCDWLYKMAPSDVLRVKDNALMTACTAGQLGSCEWLRRTLSLTSSTVTFSKCSLLKTATHSHSVQLCQWVHTNFQLSKEDACSLDNLVLRGLTREGDLPLCKWLHSTYQLSKDDLCCLQHAPLMRAIEHKHLDVCQWLYELTSEEVEEVRYKALRQAVQSNSLPICKWLHATLDYSTEEVRSQHNRILKSVLSCYRSLLCEWLCDSFAFTAEDAQLARQLQFAHTETSMWLRNRFHLPHTLAGTDE